MHSGSISVSDAAEGGALFAVRVPAKAPSRAPVRRVTEEERNRLEEAARQSLETLRSAVGASAAEDENAGFPKVLVVEDNPEMNRFICERLSGRYRPIPARDGAEGLRLAAQHSPDLILADIMMPVVRDWDFDIVLTARRRRTPRPPAARGSGLPDEALLRRGGCARIDNLVTMKRADILRELARHLVDLEKLAKAVARKRELEGGLRRRRCEHRSRADQGQVPQLVRTS
jgi:CheY-like chemotaxis protein